MPLFLPGTYRSFRHLQRAPDFARSCVAVRANMSASAAEKVHTVSEYKQRYFQLDANSATNLPVDTEIVGEVPIWLEGSLYRNGPGIFKVGNTHLRHLFDGFAVLHRFHLSKGKVTYMSRVLDTDTWQESVKANRLVATQFGTFRTRDPCKSIFARAMSYFKPQDTVVTDNTSVSIVEHGDRLYAFTESTWLLRVDPQSLLKSGVEDLKKTIAVHLATAHPHFDSKGNMYNLGTALNPPDNYNIIRIPPPSDTDTGIASQAELLASLQSRMKYSISYDHSFGMSSDHFVILEQPITMDTFKFLSSNWRSASVYDCYSKHPEKELVFRLVRRSDNKEVSIRYCADTAFTFHFINCFEDEGQLVVDFCGYSDLDIIDNFFVDRLDPENRVLSTPTFRRYVLPLLLEQAKEGENLVHPDYKPAEATLRPDGTVFLKPDYVTEEPLVMELPRINYEKANAVKYRYVYGTSIFSENPQLVKLDLKTKKRMTWEDGADFTPGEPVFVSRPGATEEDDGVILSPILSNRADQSSYLLILDAGTFTEMARAKTSVGVQMSLSFHGCYTQQKT